MKRQVVLALAVMVFAVPWSLAQEPQRPERVRRQRMQAARQMGQPAARPGADLQEIADLLDLTSEQRQQIRAILGQHREQMQAQNGPRPGQGDRRNPTEARRLLLEAARAGDDQKVEQIQKRLAQADPLRQARAQLHDQVAQVLTPEQQQKFNQWRRLREANIPLRIVARPEALREAVLKVETLSDEQKAKVESVAARYRNRAAGLDQADLAGRRDLGLRAGQEILGVLTPSQRVLLLQQVHAVRAAQGPPAGQVGPARDRVRQHAPADRPGRPARPFRPRAGVSAAQ